MSEPEPPQREMSSMTTMTAPNELKLDDLFRQYAPYVAKIGCRLLGRDGDVDDLVQDVFLAAHRGIHGVREREAIKGWLATITVRQARRKLRRRKLRTTLRLSGLGRRGGSDYDHDVVDQSATPEHRALIGQIYRLLEKIPVDQRIAWSLRYVQGESLQRVAEMCGCSLATAKRRIKAARDAIHEEISRG